MRHNSSQASIAGTNVNLDPIEKYINKGLSQKVAQTFGATTAWLTSTDKAKALQRAFGNTAAQDRETAVKYPYILLTPSAVGEDTTGRGNTLMPTRVGTAAVTTSDGLRVFNVHYIATEYTVQVEYACNSFQEWQSFASNWLFARKKAWLNFDVAYGMSTFSIRVEPEGNVSFTPRTAEPGVTTDCYICQASLTVHGFVSQSTLVEQQVTQDLQLNAQVPDGAVVWSFGREDREPVTQVRNPTSTIRVR